MDLRRHHISLGALTVAILFTLVAGVRAVEPASSSATTSAPCAQPVCADRSCRLTNTGPNNCPVCDCTPCPALNCAPGCRAEEEPLPGGRCPNCVCEVPAPHGRPEMDVPCFTPLLREALRRLAEVEEQLHHLHLLTHENGLRLHRLLPPAEHPHHHHPGGAPAGSGVLAVPETSRRGVSNTLGAVLPSKNSNEDDASDSDEMLEPHRYHHQKHHHQSHHHHQHKPPHSHHNKTHHQHSGTASQHHASNRDHNRLLQRDHQKEIKLSETEYDLAICKLQSNKAIAEELQQPVQGLISLWQQKGTRDLNVHVHVTGLKVNDSARDHRAFMHGMHVHELGNLTDGCQSTGPHFNPANSTHGDRKATVRHVGDFGNIACDKHGETNVIFTDTLASLTGPWSIVGRSINIHARMDDLGRNKDNPASVSAGDSGPRVACCIIEKVDKLPQLSSKAAKRILRDIMQPFSDFENE